MSDDLISAEQARFVLSIPVDEDDYAGQFVLSFARTVIAQAAALDAREAELSKLKDVLAKINPNEIVQAAELTRLRARIEAADRLAEAARSAIASLKATGATYQLEQAGKLGAALSAYEEAGK